MLGTIFPVQITFGVILTASEWMSEHVSVPQHYYFGAFEHNIYTFNLLLRKFRIGTWILEEERVS